MSSKSSSIEEKVKLPPTETISRCYQPQQSNRKVIRILTVAVYVLCVSLAAIMLSLYYIFIWDPTIRPFVTKTNNCDKIVIPEKIAIRLLNSSEVTAEQFYKHILEQYRILNQLQQQRQQFLQQQHIQLQQLAAGNRFQEIFATATIIQSNPNERLKKPITPTNGTYLFEPPAQTLSSSLTSSSSSSASSSRTINDNIAIDTANVPILDTAPPTYLQKRKMHRKHYNNHNHRRNQKNYKKQQQQQQQQQNIITNEQQQQQQNNNEQQQQHDLLNNEQQQPSNIMEMPLNPPTAIIQEPLVYTSMPIPLILSSSEDKRPTHHARSHTHTHAHTHGDRRGGGAAQTRKRTTMATVSGYDGQTYINPFLNGELIFEK